MERDVADAITVMEKQGAEKDQKIAALERNVGGLQGAISNMSARLAMIEAAANAFVKGLGK